MIIHGSGNRKLISQKPPQKITYDKNAAGIFPRKTAPRKFPLKTPHQSISPSA